MTLKRIVLLTLLLSMCVGVRASMSPDQAPRVAVLDFVMVGSTTNVGNWAIGVADFLQLNLQEQGVPIYERRLLRYVLAEKGLERKGLVLNREYKDIPALSHLITGTVRKRSETDFEVGASVVRVLDGAEIATASVSGRYPGEFVAKIASLAEQLKGKTSGTEKPAPRKPVVGFTSIPEAALTFYKGMDSLCAGRPNDAVLYFEKARDEDYYFDLALAWEMTAFKTLGLMEHAEVCRKQLMDGGTGSRGPSPLAAIVNEGKGKRTVALMAAQGVPAETLRILKAELVGSGEMVVLAPDTISQTTQEHDLMRLGFLEDDGRGEGWFGVDGIVFVRPTGEIDQFRVSLLDMVMATTLATAEYRRSGDPVVAARRTVHELMTQVHRGSAEVAPGGMSGKERGSTMNLSEDEAVLSTALDRASRNPADLSARLTMLHGYRFKGTAYYSRHALAEVNALVETIRNNRELPDASLYLCAALFYRREVVQIACTLDDCAPRRKRPDPIPPEMPLRPAYAELLKWYPNSNPSKYIKFGLARELSDQGKHHEALRLFEEVRDYLVADGFTMAANYHLAVARERWLCSDPDGARDALLKAGEIIDESTQKGRPISYVAMRVDHLQDRNGRWSGSLLDRYSVTQPSRGWGRKLSEGVESLKREMGGDGDKKEGARPDGLVSTTTTNIVSESLSRSAFRQRWDSVRSVTRQEGATLSLDDKTLREVAWLLVQEKTEAESREFREMVSHLAGKMRDDEVNRHRRYELLMAAGLFDEALAGARAGLDKAAGNLSAETDWLRAISEVYYYTRGSKKSLAFLKQEIAARYPKVEPELICLALRCDVMTGGSDFSELCLTKYLGARARYDVAWARAVSQRLDEAVDLLKTNIAEECDKEASLHRLKMFRALGSLPDPRKYLYPISLPDERDIPPEVAGLMRNLAMNEGGWSSEYRDDAIRRFDELKPYVNTLLEFPPLFSRYSVNRFQTNWCRIHCLTCLQKVSGKSAELLPSMTLMLYHADPYTAYMSGFALAWLREKAKPAIPALIAAHASNHSDLVSGCRTALLWVGPASVEQYPELQALLKHEDPAVRELAAKAMKGQK